MIDIYSVIFMEIHYELKSIFLIQVFPEDLKIAFSHQ